VADASLETPAVRVTVADVKVMISTVLIASVMSGAVTEMSTVHTPILECRMQLSLARPHPKGPNARADTYQTLGPWTIVTACEDSVL